MRDKVVWDDEERDDVMSLDMTDRVMGYQPFQGASTPANVSSNVWENGRRNGRKALGSSRYFRPHHSVLHLFAPVGFQAWLSHPCHSAPAMHALTACVCERNCPIWGQMCTKHSWRLALARARKLIYTCCNTRTYLWATWSPACSSLPNKMKRMLRIEQLGW